jgi:hypothetical protein
LFGKSEKTKILQALEEPGDYDHCNMTYSEKIESGGIISSQSDEIFARIEETEALL